MAMETRIRAYVVFVVVLAIAAMAAAWGQHLEFPGIWATLVLVLVAFLLQVSATNVRGGDAKGSPFFIVHLAGGLIYGAFWGGVLAIISTALGQLAMRREPIKALFNIAQCTASTASAIIVYRILGGTLPPTYLLPGASLAANDIAPQVLAFFVGAVVYFAVNSVLVSGVVAISRGKPFRQVWTMGYLWVLGYDIAGSSLSLLVAWVFLKFNGSDDLSKLAFLAIFLPLIGAKHVYAKLNTLQNLYDELDGAYEKLELNLREQLEMMVKSIEARDPYTSGHSRRVAALSKTIASDMGLEAQLVDEIENAALLHDVGKIHAEFAPLLSKEGRLTEEEWEIMKTHSAKSAELVALFSRFKGNVLDSVRWHHERWDGKGYPDGIVGETIPLGARIIMVADTIDAMSTDRPYRKALSFEKVVSELIKYRGIQFDPGLVDATINSVTIRRMVSDKDFLAEQASSIKTDRRPTARPALRSQKSFWEGLRSSVGQQ